MGKSCGMLGRKTACRTYCICAAAPQLFFSTFQNFFLFGLVLRKFISINQWATLSQECFSEQTLGLQIEQKT